MTQNLPVDVGRILKGFFAKGPNERSLFGLGLASAGVYLLAFTLPYWLPTYYSNAKDEIYQFVAREPWRGILFYVALAALFGLYLVAYRLVSRAEGRQMGPWSIGLWTLVFCLLLIPVQTITSSDVYSYVFQGRVIAVLGENPFIHPYRDFAADPFYSCVTFHNLPVSSGYGPLWIAIEGGLGWLAHNRLLLNLFLFKGLAAGLHLVSAFLVYATLKRRVPEWCVAGMLFYAWNPVLLYELVGNAHNDAVVVVLILLGFYLLSRAVASPCRIDKQVGQTDVDLSLNSAKGGIWAIPCLAAAVLIKPIVVLWLSLVAVWLLAQIPSWLRRLGYAGAIVLLTFMPAVIAYAPFWAGMSIFQGVLAQSDIYGNSLPSLLIWMLRSVWPAFHEQIVQGVKLFTVLAFAPFYLWQLWKVWRPGPERGSWGNLVCVTFDVILFYLLFVGFQFWPWYLAWLMVPAALLREPAFSVRRTLTIILCVMVPLLYFPFGWQWARDQLPAWGIALFAALPMVGLGVWLGIRIWQSQRR